ncbi:MAG: Gfo/Idh/MocA family protein [Ginsengibacter sp.]
MNSRRDFLGKITTAAIAFPFIKKENLFMKQNNENEVLKVAIMGLGSYGTRVADAMQQCKKAKLVGLISGTPSKLLSWQTKYHISPGNCYNYDNFDNIKSNPEIDAVYVITPNALHHDEVIRVAKAGKHVICEKPMAINPTEAREMIEACEKANVKLLVGYRLHFEPHTLEVIRQRSSGEFGKITFFQGLSGFAIGDPTQWRLNKSLSGGGSMMDIGIYSVNGSRYMIGEDPVWVTAEETKNNPGKFKDGIDEMMQFQLGFPGGAVASCLSTYSMNNLDRFFLDGTEGFAELYPATGYGPIRGRTNKGEINQPDVTQQTLQMDEMSDIILRGKTPIVAVDGEEALKDLKIIEAVYQAGATGKKVQLNWKE